MPNNAERASRFRPPIEARPRHPLTPPVELAIVMSPLEWRSVVACGVNVLIEAKDAVSQQLVSVLSQHLRKPIHMWSGGPIPRRSATLVIRNTATLSIGAQNAILEWLTVIGEQRRVISTSSSPLFPLVKKGRFSAHLYYRLNIIKVDLL